MIRLENISKFTELTRAVNNINCYFLKDDIEKRIADNTLFYEKGEGYTLIYENRGSYFKLYIYKALGANMVVGQKNMPIVTDFVYNKTIPSKNIAVIKELEASGFRENSQAIRFVSTLDKWEKTNHKTVPATLKQVKEIMLIWEKCFNPIENLLPPKKELEEQIMLKKVWCVCDKGRVIGVIMWNKNTIWHEAVDPSYRGQGVGNALSQAYFEQAIKAGVKKHYLWVKKGEDKAIKFHSRYGYKPDGKISSQYILP